ncbi:MAG: Cell division protein FtsA [candidate division WS2 bacterium]|nr:Cell division protein FtsA [Candidatus Psychracetigena formicireducens]
MAKNQILGLDVGSGSLKAVVAETTDDNKLSLLYNIEKPSSGLRKGVVVDMEDAASVINSVLQEVKSFSKSALKNIYLNIGGADVHSQISRGIIAVSRASSEIHRDDVTRAIQASEAVHLPSNRMILHTITREFIVDGVGDIRDPLGMVGARLEVASVVIDAFEPTVKNLMKCVELSRGSVAGLIFSPLASALSVLTKNQKELGVILMDIGYGTTGIAVYEENKLLHTNIFPVGAGHITNDLAVALKIPVEAAEKLKVSYGYAFSKEVAGRENVDLKKIDLNLKGAPSRKYIAEIIEARLGEICELINNELRLISKAGRLPGGVVLSGGGSKLPGVVELVKNELKMSSQIGLPHPEFFKGNAVADIIESPEYVAVLGLLLWARELRPAGRPMMNSNFLIKFLKNLLP